MGQRHHQFLIRDQVFDGQIGVVLDDFRASRIRISPPDLGQLLANHGEQPVRVRQYLS